MLRKSPMYGALRGERLLKDEIGERLDNRRNVLPHVVTIGVAFCGFLSIIHASSGVFEASTIALLAGIALGGIDFWFSRGLRIPGKPGIEFGYFADLVTFALAPAVLLYQWCYHKPAGEFGVFVVFLYALCAAARSARPDAGRKEILVFTGLPAPAAAAFIGSLVNINPDFEPGAWTVVCGTVALAGCELLMLSKVYYPSLSGGLRLSWPQPALTIMAGALIGLVWYQPAVGCLMLATVYLLSGPLLELLGIELKSEEYLKQKTVALPVTPIRRKDSAL